MNCRRLTVSMVRSVAPGAFELALGACTVALVLGAVQLVVAGSAVPRPATWLSIATLSVVASVWIVVPLACVGGVVAALAGWERNGGWVGLRSAGVRGRQLLPAALLVGCVSALVTCLATHQLGPMARTQIRELGRAPGALVLVPGAEARVGDSLFVAGEVGGGWASDLFFASPRGLGSADRARLVDDDGGTALELLDGVLVAIDPVPIRVTFRRWILPLERSPRVELDELRTSELLARAAATAASGRDDSYERAVAYKRWFHPLASLLLPLALLPLGVRRYPMASLGASGIGYLIAVRVGDHLSGSLGALASAALGPVFVGVLGLLLWSRWRDR